MMRRSPIRRVSLKRQRANRERRRLMEQHRNDPCLIRWDQDCTGRMQTLHEPLLRSRGGDPTSEEGTVSTCHNCHSQVHANPKEATNRGWMVPSWEGSL